MQLSGSVCERAIALPAGSPVYVASAGIEGRPGSPEEVLCLDEGSSIDWQRWQAMSRALDQDMLTQISQDIPFSEEMGIGLWYFGRVPFLERLRRSAMAVENEPGFSQSVLQSITLDRFLAIQPTLPGYLTTMATQLSVHYPNASPLQWRTWLDLSLAFSFPLPPPALQLWDQLAEHQIALPKSPELTVAKLLELLQKTPRVIVLPLSASGLAASWQIMQGNYVAAWLATATGAGVTIVLVATQTLIEKLVVRAKSLEPAGRRGRGTGRS